MLRAIIWTNEELPYGHLNVLHQGYCKKSLCRDSYIFLKNHVAGTHTHTKYHQQV